MASFGTLTDPFNVLDDVKWEHSNALINIGRLQIGSDGYAMTNDTYDLTGSSVHAQVLTSELGPAMFEFTLFDVDGSLVDFTILAGYITMRWDTGVVHDGLAIPYDGTAHRWLRFKDSGGSVLFQTSPNGIAWSTLFTGPLAITDARAQFTMITTPGTGIVYVDNLNTVPDVTPPTVGRNIYVSNINALPGGLFAPGIRGYVPPIWNISVGHWRSGVGSHELVSIGNRQITFKLDEATQASFTVNGLYEVDMPRGLKVNEASLVRELVDDTYWYRNGRLLYRGRIMGSSDEISGEGYDVSFTSNDYRALLDRRFVVTTDNNLSLPSGIFSALYVSYVAGTRVEDMIWSLIQHAESQPGMALGITKGLWEVTNVPPIAAQIQVADGTNIWEQIKAWYSMDPPFDFWIGPDIKANIAKSRGVERGVSLDYGGVLNSVRRSLDSGGYANVVRAYGATGGQPYNFPVPGSPEEGELVSSTDTPEGGWGTALPPDNTLQGMDAVQRYGKAQYDKYHRINPGAYTVVFESGGWRGPDHVWIGDTVQLVVKYGRLQIQELMRVHELSISIDQQGAETVTAVLNKPDNPDDNLRNFVRFVTRR